MVKYFKAHITEAGPQPEETGLTHTYTALTQYLLHHIQYSCKGSLADRRESGSTQRLSSTTEQSCEDRVRWQSGLKPEENTESSYNCLRRLTHLNLQGALVLRHSFKRCLFKREKKYRADILFTYSLMPFRPAKFVSPFANARS